MNSKLTTLQKYLLIAILIASIFLIFFHLTRAGLQGDDAHYSFRSIGYIDFVSSLQQTTPYQWYDGLPPWWSHLSFHDHPPLVFAIQHLFFKTFGVNDFVAKLPFALAGWGLILITFLIAQKLFSTRVGLLAASLLALNASHVWMSQTGYLESIVTFFMALSLLFFIKGVERPKKFLLAGLFLGLALLSKYTALLLIPVYLIYALINFKIFKNKYFWFSLLIAFIIFSPVILYNIMMFSVRDHFDVQFAIFFNQGTVDWPVLSNRTLWHTNYFQSFLNIFKVLGNSVSWPVLLIWLTALITFIINWLQSAKKNSFKTKKTIIVVLTFFLLLFFTLTSQNNFYLTTFNFTIALLIAWLLIKLYDFLKNSVLIKWLYLFLIIIFFSYSFIYGFNTNYRSTKPTDQFLFSSELRRENLGFDNLDNFIAQELKNKYPEGLIMNFSELNRFPPQYSTKYKSDKTENLTIFVYDTSLIWFTRLWYFERWRFYKFYPFFATSELDRFIDENLKEFLLINGDQDLYIIDGQIYFIIGAQDKQFEINRKKYGLLNPCTQLVREALDAQPDKKIIKINNNQGQTMFYLYKFNILSPLNVCPF